MFKINIVENKIKHVIMIFFVFIMNFTVSQAVETVPTVSNPTVFSSLIMSFGELVFSGVTKVNGAVVIIFLGIYKEFLHSLKIFKGFILNVE